MLFALNRTVFLECCCGFFYLRWKKEVPIGRDRSGPDGVLDFTGYKPRDLWTKTSFAHPTPYCFYSLCNNLKCYKKNFYTLDIIFYCSGCRGSVIRLRWLQRRGQTPSPLYCGRKSLRFWTDFLTLVPASWKWRASNEKPRDITRSKLSIMYQLSLLVCLLTRYRFLLSDE